MKTYTLYLYMITVVLVFSASSGLAAIQCYHCHGTPNPIDFRPTDSSFRNSSSGGFQGNHRTHLTANASPASCTICHPGSNSYTASHRDGSIKVLISSKKSVLAAKYKNSTSAWAQTAEPDLDTCNSVNCHFETITPIWGSEPAATTCNVCHGAPPAGDAGNFYLGGAAGSHTKHGIYYSGPSSCAKCHSDHTADPNPFIHATSGGNRGLIVQPRTPSNAVSGTYSVAFTPITSYLPGRSASHSAKFGTCLSTYCHGATMSQAGDKNGGTNITPTWGAAATGQCGTCHGATATNPPRRGSHQSHTGSGQWYYGDFPNYLYARSFSCTVCHKNYNPRHVDGNADWSFDSVGKQWLSGALYKAVSSGSVTPVPSTYGQCSNLYCHSIVQTSTGGPLTGIAGEYKTPTWGNINDGKCGSCHAIDAQHAWYASLPDGTPEISSGSHLKHLMSLDARMFAGIPERCAVCHNYSGRDDLSGCSSATCHGAEKNFHVDHKVDVKFPATLYGASAAYTGSPSPGDGFGSCNNTYCHSNGVSVATGTIPANTSPTWGSGMMACSGCHGNKTYSDYRKAFPLYTSNRPNTKANSHRMHTAYSCEKCHYNTTINGLTIASQVTHVNKSYNVNFGPGTSFTYSYNLAGGTCNSISCHGTTNAQWGSTACLGCHSVVQGNRAAITSQFGANSHHIQGTVTDAKCYLCHWEANSDGSINSLYHGGSAAPGSVIDLVVYGPGTRPATYTASTFLGEFSNSGGSMWTKGKPITINNTGNSNVLSNYQIKINVTYVSGMKSDFSDLRFADGAAELYYWIESYTASTSATIWVKLRSIPASSSKTIYMYYGNASAIGVSNVSSTMIPNMITAMEGNCPYYDACSDMRSHSDANWIRNHYAADIGTRVVSSIYWGSVWDGSSPGSNTRNMFYSRFRFLFIPDTGGTWNFAVDSDDSSELIWNPNDGNAPSGETVITSWYREHAWANGQPYPGSINMTANQQYWLDFLQGEGGGEEAAVLWAKKPGETWKNLSAQNYPNMIFARQYTSPEPSFSIGAEEAANIGVSTIGTSVQYNANGTRAEIPKINYHCLSCHSDQNNSATPFGDGKTPKQYAWDGTSVGSRYTQNGTTQWSKYTENNVTPKHLQTKAYSAHGNALKNQGGWDLTETWSDKRSVIGNVTCYDCHNSHGSTITGITTRYASATVNGGILKDTIAGKGGYAVTYKPYTGGSVADKNKRNPGASICLDCHLTKDAGATPWGYSSTFGATQSILGYWDSPFMGYTTSGAEQRYPFKKKNPVKGGHFGASSALSSTPTATIGGLCTPCHDPHGVSPTLGSQQQYAVPLLKGTWLTSPYKEDTAPLKAGAGTDYPDQDAFRPNSYFIDQNTFGLSLGGTIPSSTFKNVTTAAGLCLGCHPKNSLTDGTTHTWKSKDRIHEAVNGWKTANGTVKHNYSCSKCHSAHTNAVLPRLMVTDCLDSPHKGRSGFNEFARAAGGTSVTGYNGYGSGSGSGRLPGVYSGYGSGGAYYPSNGPGTGSFSTTCHESPAANNGANSNLDQSWNVKTPWNDIGAPTIISGAAGNTQATISWIPGVGATSSLLKYGTATGVYGSPIEPVTSPNTITSLTNGQTIFYRVGARSQSGTITWSTEYNVTPLLVAPSGVSATANGIGIIRVSWTKPSGAMGYRVLYGTTTGYGSYNPSSSTYLGDVNSVDISGLTIGTTYHFAVIAHYANGDSAKSSNASAMATTVLPTAPTGVSAAAISAGTIRVTWTKPTGATGYRVLYGTTTGYGSFNPSSSTYLGDVNYVDIPSLASGTLYHFAVIAHNVAGDSANSSDAAATTRPAAPNGVTAVANGAGTIRVSWTKSTSATGYRVLYGTTIGYGSYSPSSSTYLGDVNFVDIPSLANGTLYHFAVIASNVSGNSVNSSDATATTLPAAPTGVTAVANGAGTIRVSWTKPTGATGYRVLYGTTTGYGSYNPSSSTYLGDVNFVDIPSLASGTLYHFVVIAHNVAGDSANSFDASAATILAAPTGVLATPIGAGQIRVSWTKSTGATGYRVLYGTTTGYGSFNPSLSTYLGDVNYADVSGLTIGTLYHFAVIANNAYGDSGNSLDASATSSEEVPPLSATPSAPTGTIYTDCGTSTKVITYSWTASPTPNVDYQVQVDDDSNFGSPNYVSPWLTAGELNWSQDTAQGTWYWKVLTKDRGTSLAAWSGPLSYTLAYGGDCGGSCPMLFTWDGEKFAFETDLFPRGSLGRKYSSGYQKPNPNDYYLLRHNPETLEDGFYNFRLTGERPEIDYLDNIRLYTIDIPQNRDLYSEIHYTGTSYVKPETLLHTVDKQLQHPIAVKHVDTGKDVSALLAASDEKYLVLSKDKNNDFNWQTIELDLGDLSQARQIKLILNARTAFFTTEAGSARARKLDSKGRRTRIEVLDAHGKWVEVPHATKELPIPKEFRRDFVVDISDIFLTSNYKVRLSFLNKTYIDAIYLDTTKDEPIKITEVPFESGTLNYYGLSARTNPGEAYGYSYGFKIDNKTNYLPGYYTRFGDVTPLLTQTDDKFVILGMGDELRLKFKKATAIPTNNSRKFMVYTNGYYKSVKFDVPHTVEPLPFAGMSNFPYDETVEHYPMDADHNLYQQKYNTRKQGKTNEAACCSVLPEIKTAHAAEITIVPQNAEAKEQPLAAKPIEKEVIVLEAKKSPDLHVLPMQWLGKFAGKIWLALVSILVWLQSLFAW